MLSSLFTAITGLQSFQTYLSVISNNIANVNTVGFKGNETNFETIVSQNIRGAAAPTATAGGTDPKQIGLGVQIGGNMPVFTQGNAMTTGKPTDFMIQGNGFFAVNSNGSVYYTRNGAFDRDGNGNIANPNTGMMLLGFPAQGSPPVVNTNAPLQPINIPTTYASFTVATDGTVSGVTSTGTTVPLGQIALTTFPNPSGLMSMNNSLYTPTLNTGTPNTTNASWTFTTPTTILTSYNQQPTVPSLFVPSSTMATPTSLTIGGAVPAAALAGLPANSTMQVQFQVANAANVASAPSVLVNGAVSANIVAVMSGNNIAIQYPAGTTVMTVTIPAAALGTNATGAALNYTLNLGATGGVSGTPGTQGLGTITAGALEMSNVDLSREFSNMIVAERGFQANSKTITTADSILMTLVNMKSQG
jgi:flagellar hook protein FlgE